MARRGLLFFSLLAIWIILSGNLDRAHLSMGLISCALVTWMSGDLVFADPAKSSFTMVREGLRLVFSYLPWLTWQIVLANIQVLRFALRPGPLTGIDPLIISYRTSLKSNFARMVFANSITLTPGTITLEIQGDLLYVHALNAEIASGIGGEMERRVAWVFESSRS